MFEKSSNLEVLILPGWADSGPEHWQTLWEKEHPEFKRVIQKDWIDVKLEDWLAVLDQTIAERNKPAVLVAHSLSCILVAHWAKLGRPGVQGALLVAPTDVERHETCPPETWGFGPIPLQPLPFKSIVVASENDPYLDLARAKHFAQCWRSDFVNIGSRGHINAASNQGSWPEGQELLSRLL
jgi:uncharacterized protein